MSKIDISIIIPTYNEEKYLPILLESLKEQKTTLVREIIIVDDHSTDKTFAIAISHDCITLKNTGKQTDVVYMRNLGLKYARGKCILFMDADCACSKNYIEKMARPIVDGKVDVTLAMRHMPLETKYRVYPEKYSHFLAFVMKYSPKILWTKVPVRFFLWIKNWILAMKTQKKWISIFEVPDRVHTAAIVVLTRMAKKTKGWRGEFGTHVDTRYCHNIFSQHPKVKWQLTPILYYSHRRIFPIHFIESLFFILKIKTKNYKKNLSRSHNKGYQNPKGIR